MARIKDADPGWIKQSFILPENSLTEEDMYRRVISTADFKFTDTTVGGNFAINPPPQFTRYADIKTGGLSWGDEALAGADTWVSRRKPDTQGNASHAMGRFYSESIDDNSQVVTMRFGVPEYNSLLMFFGTFYKHSAAVMARSGRGNSLAFSIGKAAGAVVALPFQPLILGMQIYRFMSKSPPSKMFYLKPTMPLYWNAVNTIANGIAVNMGLIPPVYSDAQNQVMGMQPFSGDTDINAPGNTTARDAANAGMYQNLLPGIYTARGGIDLYAVATRAQRLANHYNTEQAAKLDRSGQTLGSLRSMAREFRANMRKGPAAVALSGNKGIDAYLNSWFGITDNIFTNSDTTDQAIAGDRSQYDLQGGGGNGDILQISGKEGASGPGALGAFFMAELKDGASFVNFRVDFSGDSSESFSSSTRESEIASKLNSMSSSNRESRINFADGNIGDDLFSGVIEKSLSMVKDVAMGTLESIHLSGLAAIAGNAFVDMPKHWDNSSVDFPRADYTIQLRSPYGNKMSRFQNLMIPLAMLLAGALPLSTGKHSYTSPFICEFYCKGRNSIRTGIIDRLSVTRGTGNMGWTTEGEPLGIDISFSVVDLSTVMHMPITAHFSLWKGLAAAAASNSATADTILTMTDKDMYDDDNSFTDYLAVLGSLNFNDQVYPTSQWRLRRTLRTVNYESWRSPAHMANWFFGTLPGRTLNALAVNTDRTN